MPEIYRVMLELNREAFLELSAALKTRNATTKANHLNREALDWLIHEFDEWKSNHKHPAF
jgi:hypothetical protein